MPEPPGTDGRRHVAVVGGGITGLATAWFLRGRARVTLVEADRRLGGKISTAELAGVPVEAGPDTFLARAPHAADLCRAVGLGGDLVAPATGRAYVWTRGRLRALPEEHVMGVPLAAGPFLRSGIVSPAGAARAALDLVLPRRSWGPDPSVADVVRGRMGDEVLDRLVEPLVGGINAGRADGLSLAATAPPLAAAAGRHRSLVLGLRRDRRAPGAGAQGPVFLGVRGGMGRLVERLAAEVGAGGTETRLGTRATGLERAGGDGAWRVACEPGPGLVADAVVLTVPAFAAARLLRTASPAAAAELDAVSYVSVSVATLGYRPEDVPGTLDGAGFLVPRVDGRLMTACTWSTAKWPELASCGLVLLRASAGRAGDDRAGGLDDGELVDRLHAELAEAVGARGRPVASLVSCWPRAFPQQAPGHEARVGRVEAALAADAPGVVVAGAAYRGLGISACVRQAGAAADRCLAAFGGG